MNGITKIFSGPDRHIFSFINHNLRCGPLDRFMSAATAMGSTGFSVTTSLILLAAGRIYGSSVGMDACATLVLSQTAVQTLKRLIDRPRPFIAIENTIFMKPPACRYSFPSGHTCAAFAVALPIATAFPFTTPLVLAAACIVGVSRIYLGFHYPTDVLAGFAITAYAHSHITWRLIDFFQGMMI